MAKLRLVTGDVKQRTFRATNGATRGTRIARGQTDLLGQLLAGAVTRYLMLVTPREEVMAVTQMFVGELH